MSLLFAETLRKLRTEKGLSQRDLAERLYVTRSTVNRWENQCTNVLQITLFETFTNQSAVLL